LVLTVAAAILLAALAVERWINRAPEAPAAAPVPATGVEDNAIDAPFSLRIRAESASYRFGEGIQVTAWLTYSGPKEREELAASFSGIVLYSWEQLDGPLRREAGYRLNCQSYAINRGQPIRIPFAKSGAFSGEDPDAAFWRQYFADPDFHLPVGRYRIHAKSYFFIHDCQVSEPGLDAAVEIDVRP